MTLSHWIEEQKKLCEGAKEIWCDDMGSRKFGPWSEIKDMSWPDHDYVRYGIVYTDRKVHGVITSLPKALEIIEEMRKALEHYKSLARNDIHEHAKEALRRADDIVKGDV